MVWKRKAAPNLSNKLHPDHYENPNEMMQSMVPSKNYQTKHDTRIQSYLFDLKVIQLFSGDRIISCQLKQKNHFEIIVLCKNHTATKL